MKQTKPMGLIISLSTALALATVALVFLVRSMGRYHRVRSDLQQTMTRIERLRAGDPRHQNRFPNVENVAITRSNLEAIETAVEDLLEVFLRDQTEAEPLEPARFPLLLDRTVRSLNEAALINNIPIPDRFAYGFERYATALPVRRDIPRLTRQLAQVERLCRILFEARIRELTAIERQVFEGARGAEPAAGAGPRRRITAEAATRRLPAGEYRDPGGLFTRERYVFSLRVREAHVWNVLNALARMSPVVVVSRVEISNPAVPGAMADPGEDPDAPLPAALLAEITAERDEEQGDERSPRRRIRPHQERIVAGQNESVDMRLSVDMFHFRAPGAEAPQRRSP